jgi:hypothetical protein
MELELGWVSEDSSSSYDFRFFSFDSHHADMNKTRALRHVYLIRHGQYQTKTKSEDQKQLTELGLRSTIDIKLLLLTV